MNRQRSVLVTGGMGFVGGHLSEALLLGGDRVTALDDLSTGKWDNVARLADDPNFHAVIGNVEDRVVLDRLMSEADLVVHLAAVVGVELIVADPIRTIETNINGTAAVLAAARRYRVKTLIASTSEVFGKSPQLPFHEEADVLLGPSSKNRWSYAASKMVDEFLGFAYHTQHNLPVVVFRLFNTVGPRQSGQYGMVIPRMVQAALDGRPVPIHGDGLQSRTFLHVFDAVDAIQRLAVHDVAVGRLFNVGSNNLITIADLAQRVLERVDLWNATSFSPATVAERVRYISYDDAYEPGFEDMRARRPDTSRLSSLTGWSATRTLDDILDDVIADRAILQVH